MKTPKIKRQTICAECHQNERYQFVHDPTMKGLFTHKFQPRLETIGEAAYRQGYETGYNEAESKAHWNSGGISWN